MQYITPAPPSTRIPAATQLWIERTVRSVSTLWRYHCLPDATTAPLLQVAEMTGRKGRLVRSKSGAGVVYEARNASGVDAGAPALASALPRPPEHCCPPALLLSQLP